MSSSEVCGVLNWLWENDRAAYRNCGAILASRRKLRPVFVERKTRDERNFWIKECLSKPANADLALELLQVWTLGKNGPMVCEFLDALEIPHDGKGLIDAIPSEPSSIKVEAAVDALLAKNEPFSVFVYLHLFSAMDDGAWPVLNGLLQTKTALDPISILVTP